MTTADLLADPLLDRFAQAAARVGARTEAIAGGDHAAVVAELRRVVGPGPAVLSPEAWARWGRPTAGWTCLDGDHPTAIADAEVAVTVAVAAIAETGSVVLVEPDRAALLLDLWAHHLVVAVDRAHLLATLPDAAPVLARATTTGVVTVLSGPSRTADIERKLSIGVQGPREVTVVVIG